jgi:hypothetical protein
MKKAKFHRMTIIKKAVTIIHVALIKFTNNTGDRSTKTRRLSLPENSNDYKNTLSMV